MQEVPPRETLFDSAASTEPAKVSAAGPPPISAESMGQPAAGLGSAGGGSPGGGGPSAGTPLGPTDAPPVLPPRSGGGSAGGIHRPGGRGAAGGGRRGMGFFGWVMVLVVLMALVCIGGGVYWLGQLGGAGGAGLVGRSSVSHSDLREVVLEQASTRDKILVVEMQGVISSDPMDYQGNTLVTFIEEQLERAAEDTHVRAVLLKIDSPGGEVLASDEIYKLLIEFQEEHDKPVIAAMGTVAASGGYYIAAPCRWIVANELTITGSIGVIMQSYNWRGLMDKVGVRPQVFKSGVFKDMLSPDKAESEITSEERRMVQDLVNETFEKFKAVIEEGRGLAHARNEDNEGEGSDRGRALASNWQDYADGRLLSGKEAWKLGFVDELGDFSAAFERARKLAGIEDAKLIQYLRPPSFGSLFRLLGASEKARVQVDLGLRVPQLRAGLYFLAPHLVH